MNFHNIKEKPLMNLKEMALDIRRVISEYQEKNKLSFVEDTHTYFIEKNRKIISSGVDMPSVSSVLHSFYMPFDSHGTKSFQSRESILEKANLLLEWKGTADYATNMGSRVHYELEKYLVGLYGAYKDIRLPIFSCDFEQTVRGDAMIKAGKDFIEGMHKIGAVLIDTETIMGNNELGYFGQPDKVWLVNKRGKIGIVITDWKTNKEENMTDVKMPWTGMLLEPFEDMLDNDISKYSLQLPLYGKMLRKMLENSKYKDLEILNCIIVHLRADASFHKIIVENELMNRVLDLDVKYYLSTRRDIRNLHRYYVKRDADIITENIIS